MDFNSANRFCSDRGMSLLSNNAAPTVYSRLIDRLAASAVSRRTMVWVGAVKRKEDKQWMHASGNVRYRATSAYVVVLVSYACLCLV